MSEASFSADPDVPYIDRVRERKKIVAGLAEDYAALVTGGPGVGKATLSREALRDFVFGQSGSQQRDDAFVVVVSPRQILEAENGFAGITSAFIDTLPADKRMAHPATSLAELTRLFRETAREMSGSRFAIFFPSFHRLFYEEALLSEFAAGRGKIAEICDALASLQLPALNNAQTDTWTRRFSSMICGLIPRDFSQICGDVSSFVPREIVVGPLLREEVQQLVSRVVGDDWQAIAQTEEESQFLMKIEDLTYFIPRFVRLATNVVRTANDIRRWNRGELSFPDGIEYEVQLQIAGIVKRCFGITTQRKHAAADALVFEETDVKFRQLALDTLLLREDNRVQRRLIPTCRIIEGAVRRIFRSGPSTGKSHHPVVNDETLRGQIVSLLGKSAMSVAQLALATKSAPTAVERIVSCLVAEGALKTDRNATRAFRSFREEFFEVDKV